MPRGVGVDLQETLSRVSERRGFFDYVRSELLPTAVEWHVNFADPILFGAYGTVFFAQDEIADCRASSLGGTSRGVGGL